MLNSNHSRYIIESFKASSWYFSFMDLSPASTDLLNAGLREIRLTCSSLTTLTSRPQLPVKGGERESEREREVWSGGVGEVEGRQRFLKAAFTLLEVAHRLCYCTEKKK